MATRTKPLVYFDGNAVIQPICMPEECEVALAPVPLEFRQGNAYRLLPFRFGRSSNDAPDHLTTERPQWLSSGIDERVFTRPGRPHQINQSAIHPEIIPHDRLAFPGPGGLGAFAEALAQIHRL